MDPEIDDSGALTMGGAAEGIIVPESDLLKVVYNDNTRFYDSISLKGSIKDDVFYADEVRIIKLG